MEPLVAPLADGKVIVVQEDQTVVLNEEGACTQKCPLTWTDIPIAMGRRKHNICDVLLVCKHVAKTWRPQRMISLDLLVLFGRCENMKATNSVKLTCESV